MKRKAIICDIDGTLANVDHRRPFLDEKPPDWKSFKESCVTDTINKWCIALLAAMHDAGFDIILVSGRDQEYDEPTINWLREEGVKYTDLFMRSCNQKMVSDEFVKERIYRDIIEPQYNVLFVIDDRSRVVNKWREMGLVCLQCAPGDF